MATHSSILAWEIAWTEVPGGRQSIGSHRLRHNQATECAQRGGYSGRTRSIDGKVMLGPRVHINLYVRPYIRGHLIFSDVSGRSCTPEKKKISSFVKQN